MTVSNLASRRAATISSKPDAIPTTYVHTLLGAHNATELARMYPERGNIAAARRKLVRALASVNELQGGAA
jgi:hypothetical protein